VRGDRGDRQAGRGGLLEDRRAGLPVARVGVVGPLHVVEQPVLAGDGGDEAEDAVPAGGDAGAEGDQADGGGARARGVEVARRRGQRREHGGEVRVLAQQVGTQAVDEQDRDPAGAGQRGGEVERVRRQAGAVDVDAQGGGHAGQDVGEGRGAVRRAHEVRGQRAAHGRVASTCRPVATSR
jgi:hypothetical protein